MRERHIQCFLLRTLCRFLACIFFLSGFCMAQDNPEIDNSTNSNNEVKTDAEGCADLPVLPKLPASIITSCQSGDSVEVVMPLTPDAQGYPREVRPRGPFEFRSYDILDADQQEQAFGSLTDLLGIAGFKVKYSEPPATITARKENTWMLLQVSGSSYTANVVSAKEEPWAAIQDAAGIAHEMDVHYHAAIYGIQFSEDNEAVVAENSQILGQVLKYLKSNPQLVVGVESHKWTDENGTAQSDLEITRKRAKAVVSWLEANGITRERLQARALGRSKPLTENDTASEIQRNERIELAKAVPEAPAPAASPTHP